MPRFALALGVLSLACSLSVAAFFVGVPLGLLAVVLALSALRYAEAGSRSRRAAWRGMVVGGLGLVAGLGVWFVHVRAVQTAYSVPSRAEVHGEFERSFAGATAPLPGAPPRGPRIPGEAAAQPPASSKDRR